MLRLVRFRTARYASDMNFDREAFRQALAAELRAEKSALRLTNNELAEVIGATERTVRRYLNGERSVDTEHVVLLADAFGKRPGDLISQAMNRMENS